MNFKRLSVFLLLFFSLSLLFPRSSDASGFQVLVSSGSLIAGRVQEGLEYLFAFKVENKVAVLEKQAERRLTAAQSFLGEKNMEKVQSMLKNYLQLKDKQGQLLEKNTSEGVLEKVKERTIEQQKVMEEMKINATEDTRQEVIQVQEQVVNQVAKHVVDKSGSEGKTEFFQKVEHVWAPGTAPREGMGGVVIVGGVMQFAPGTSAGGPAVQDIKTVEIKTGGTVNDPVPVQDGPNYAPGTIGGSPGNTVESSGGNTIDPGTVDPGNTVESSGGNTIDPGTVDP